MSIARRFACVLASGFEESCLFEADCSFDDVFDDLKMRNMIPPATTSPNNSSVSDEAID